MSVEKSQAALSLLGLASGLGLGLAIRSFSGKSVVCSPVEKWRAAAGDVSLHKNAMCTNTERAKLH